MNSSHELLLDISNDFLTDRASVFRIKADHSPKAEIAAWLYR